MITTLISSHLLNDDADRNEIWQMLVSRDIAAFCASDWDAVANDFEATSFLGIRGHREPGAWAAEFPTLSHYRDEWLRQASLHASMKLRDESMADFLTRATRLGL